jgi:two-component system sensor kinase FixL
MMLQRTRRELIISSHRKGRDEVEVRVKDSGVGIRPEIVQRIFDPFYTTKPKGIGLGLSISRTIIEAHDGKLWATPGTSGGASLHFTIPVRL